MNNVFSLKLSLLDYDCCTDEEAELMVLNVNVLTAMVFCESIREKFGLETSYWDGVSE